MSMAEIRRHMADKRKREAQREASRKATAGMFWFKHKRDQQQDWG
jgi:hypothetical protein